MNNRSVKSVLGKLVQFFTNRSAFCIIYIIAALLSSIPLLMQLVDPLQKVCFLWGTALLLWDLLTKRIMFTGYKAGWLFLFVFSYGITVLLNMEALYEGVKHMVYSCILLFIFYPFDTKGDLEKQKRTLVTINDIFNVVTFAASLISIVLYLLQMSYFITVDGIEYGQGVLYNRLYGIYISANPGGLLSICTIFLTFLTYWLDRKHFHKFRWFYYANCVIQFVYYTLTLSNGAKLAWIAGIAAFGAVFVFPYVKKRFKRNAMVSIVLAVAISAGCYMVFEGATSASRSLVLSVTNAVQNLGSSANETVTPDETTDATETTTDAEAEESAPTEPSSVVLERVEGDDADANNGRFSIWEAGLAALKQKPVFGWADGQFYRNGELVIPLDESQLTDVHIRWLKHARGNMHNAVVQIVVYSGLLGLLLFVVFAVLAGTKYIRELVKLSKRGDYYLLAAVFVLIVMLISQMAAESHILFSHADPFACIFWMYLGFGFQHIRAEKRRLAQDFAFVCDTPLQVLNAVSMVASNAEGSAGSSDLFLYHQFKNSEELSERVKESGVFRNVYDFTPFPKKTGVLSKLTTFTRILNPAGTLAKQHRGKGNPYMKHEYGTLLLSFYTPFSDIVHLALDTSRTVQFEDGTASYVTENLESRYRSGIFEAYNQYIACGKLSYNPEMLYLSNPAFCGHNALPLRKMAGIGDDDRVLETAKDIFAFANSSYKSKRVVYLTQPFGPAEGGEEVFAKERECLPLLKTVDPIVRVHPRQSPDAFSDFQIDTTCNMWELECADSIDDKNVLIGAFSTAQFAPKMMFDREPVLVFLYKLYGCTFNNADEMVEKIRASYRDPQKVMVPQSKEEFAEIVKSL